MTNDFISTGNWRHQCLKQLRGDISEMGAVGVSRALLNLIGEAYDDLGQSNRFVLPAGMGMWYEVMPQIDFTVDRLPFDLVAFEYSPAIDSNNDPVSVEGKVIRRDLTSSKRIVLAKQMNDSIFLRFFFYDDSSRAWNLYPFGTLLANVVNEKKKFIPTIEGMETRYHAHTVKPVPLGELSAHALSRGVTDAHIWADTQEESHVVAVVLEMLGCKNVIAERVDGKKKNSSKVPLAVKDDHYRLTVINTKTSNSSSCGEDGESGDRARPSEHLRRGHAYRPKPGVKMWRQGCVVNPGIGRRVVKDYRID